MIERAGPEVASAVHALTRACAREMRRRGFHNWDAPPSPERLTALATAPRALLVARAPSDSEDAIVGGVLGAVSVGPTPVRPYAAALAAGRVRWAAPDGTSAAYVSALAVHPAWQGRGVGVDLLRAAEREAGAWDARVVRLDALAANAGLLAFYGRLGYAARGRRSHDGWEFACLERVLSTAAGTP